MDRANGESRLAEGVVGSPPYFIEGDPLTNGLNLLHAAVLVGMTAVALVSFERRDVQG